MEPRIFLAILDFFFALVMGILYVSASMKKKNRTNFYFSRLSLSHMILLLLESVFCVIIGHPNLKVLILICIGFDFLYALLVAFFYHLYVINYIHEHTPLKPRPFIGAYLAAVAVGFAIWASSYFTKDLFFFDENYYFHYTSRYWICQMIFILMIIPDIVYVFRNLKTLGLARVLLWSTFPLLPLVSRTMDLRLDLEFSYVFMSLTILLCYVMINQDMDLKLHEQQVALGKRSLEVQSLQQKVMVSQIQPHFLYNVLNTICFLCKKDPQRAAEVTADFSNYLRGNLNAIAKDEPVFFEEELEHVQTYLRLESQRFGEAMDVEYDLEARNFFLPALSLQPIVENSVKHGICQNDDGGWVKITTRDDVGVYTVVIEDNGVGFDASHIFEDENLAHVGIANTRRRIRNMCHGDLSVESTVGVGTKVTITLPKASNCSFLENRNK